MRFSPTVLFLGRFIFHVSQSSEVQNSVKNQILILRNFPRRRVFALPNLSKLFDLTKVYFMKTFHFLMFASAEMRIFSM